MFRRILVPLDGSAFAEAALPAAFTLARKNSGEIRFLCVLEPVGSYPGALHTPDKDWAKGYLAKTSERTQQTWDGVLTTAVRNGRATDEIRAEAEDWGTDVVVLATHGRGGLSRAWMGSVTDHFIRTATQPVLAIRPTEAGAAESAEPLAMGKVVVPLDGSQLAEAALPFGATLAKQFGAPLVLMRTVPLPRVPDLSVIMYFLQNQHSYALVAQQYTGSYITRVGLYNHTLASPTGSWWPERITFSASSTLASTTDTGSSNTECRCP